MVNKIKRVTNVQKKIINEILLKGLDRFLYNDWDDVKDLAIRYDVHTDEIYACIDYVENKFFFWRV